MDLRNASVLIAGATGEMGSGLARALGDEGARVALVGRDADRLARLGEELDAPTARFDARDPASCETAVSACAAALGGLDVLVVACGVAAFAPADGLDPPLLREVFEVNALGPIALIEAALGHLSEPGAVAAVSAVVADFPMAGLAHYSAAKAALAAYLAALRHERRRDGLTVLDVKPPHVDTGFAERPLTGTAPRLPEPIPADDVVSALVEGLREGRREVSWDLAARSLVTR